MGYACTPYGNLGSNLGHQVCIQMCHFDVSESYCLVICFGRLLMCRDVLCLVAVVLCAGAAAVL
jgi:hypothetical protein